MKTQKELESMQKGDVLVVGSAMKNVPDWTRSQGYNVDIDEVGEGEWEVIIEK